MWTVKQVHNGRKEFIVERHTGESVKVRIPVEHQTQVLSDAYLKATQDAHDAAIKSSVHPSFIEAAVLLCLAAIAVPLAKVCAACCMSFALYKIVRTIRKLL